MSTYDATLEALQEMLTGTPPGMEHWAVGTIVGNYLGATIDIHSARSAEFLTVHHAAGHVLASVLLRTLRQSSTSEEMFLNFCCNGLYNNFHQGAMSWIAFDHHGRRLEDRHGDLSHGQLLMVGLLRRDDRSIGGQHEVDTGVWNEVGLELRDIHVQGSIEAKRCCQA